MSRAHVIVLLFYGNLMLWGCTKPPHIHAGGSAEELGPIVKEVRLADTISPSFTRALQLENVTGNAFQYPSGDEVSYFTYDADPGDVLQAIARLPFPMRDQSADVSYHDVNREEWDALRRTVGAYEISGAAFFWDVDPADFNIYASVKNEHHLLLVEKAGRRLHHRISPS